MVPLLKLFLGADGAGRYVRPMVPLLQLFLGAGGAGQYVRPMVPLLQLFLGVGGAGRYVCPLVPLQVPAQQAAHQEGGWLPPPSQAHQVKGR